MGFFKNHILLSFFIVLSNSLLAQQFKPGFFVGFNNPEIDGLPESPYFGPNRTKISLMFGASVRTEINEKLNIEMQLGYSQLGMRKPTNPHWNDYTTWNLTLDYLQIPIMANINAYKKISASPGISIGRLVGVRAKDPFFIMSPVIKEMETYKKFDFSAFLYINYSLTEMFSPFAGISHSLIPINSEAEEPFIMPFRYNPGFYNVSWHLGTRIYLFSQKK